MLITQERDNFTILNFLDEFMQGHRGFICGGCFKNIFNHEKIKDLDIFFESHSDWEEAVAYFDARTPNYTGEDKRDEEYHFHYLNDNVKAYKHIKTGIVLELCCKTFGTAKDILSKFDFTITKFAYYKAEVDDATGEEVEKTPFTNNTKTHIEYKVMYDDKFFEHLHMKRLVTDDLILFPMSTFERTIRYAKYGYSPCRETKLKIIKALREVPENLIEVSKSLYDGMD